jgi:hypothetical protein
LRAKSATKINLVEGPQDGRLHWYFFTANNCSNYDFKDVRILNIMNKYPVDMNCLLSECEASGATALYHFKKLSPEELQEWLTVRGYSVALSRLNFYGKDSVELAEELKLVILMEVKRMREEMIEACRNIYKNLLALGYTAESLNRPFNTLLK